MIPYSYNMVDMGGIDLAEANGTEVPGVYEKIIEAMNLCGDLILYNWKFAGINIAPSAYTVLQQANSILINGLIQVTELDLVTVIGIPPPLVPVSPLNVSVNGLYEAEPPASGFNPVIVAVPGPNLVPYITIESNGVYSPPTGFDGFAAVEVDVSLENSYTNGQVYPLEEQITDVSGFTLLYNSSISFGNNGQKVAARLAITDESEHSALQSGGWSANGMAYYDSEYLIGAYGGYDFGEAIFIQKAKFWLNRYSGQNLTLIATVEYLDENENWNEIEDLDITAIMSYPSYVFEVPVNRSVYGIRWIHKKTPNKSPGNNITFAGMSVYRGSGEPVNVYIPDSSGLIMPPEGYTSFGPLYIS